MTMRLTRLLLVAAVTTLGASACGDDSAPITDDAAPRRRLPPPSPGEARAIPPHDIHPEGVGPYLLGASLRSILSTLPHGPRVELMQLEGIADHSLVRADGDKVVLGVQKPKGVTFISVLAPQIARTEKEVGVGTTLAELTKLYGEPHHERSHASDPRIIRVRALPTVRFVLRRGRIVAVVVARAPAGVERNRAKCGDDALRAREADIRKAARLGPKSRVSYGCFGSSRAEALVVSGQRIAVVQQAGEQFKRVAVTSVPGLAFASAIEVDGDDRDEILAVTDTRADTLRKVSVVVYRADGGRFSPLARQPVYELDDSAASWLGAKPADIDFLLEADASGGLVTVSGLYVHRSLLGARDVVPLTPVPVVVRRRKSPSPSPSRTPASAVDGGIRAKSPR